MALNISGATIGTDVNGVNQAIQNLEVHVIQDTISKMNSSMENLRNAVDEAWVGKSAEVFKSNLDSDRNTVAASLNDTFTGLKSEINQIVSRMGEADEALVQGR